MDKKQLSERDICTKFITPSLRQAGWDEMTQLREEVSFTKGRIIVRGKMVSRGKAKRADYILYYKPNIPLAVIEAKDNNCGVGDGMQQALGYAETLQVPFVFSSNGDGFVFHDRSVTSGAIEKNLQLHEFPSPATLWARYREWKGLPPEAEPIVAQDYFNDGSGKEPRYYQASAVNAATEAIAKGQNRLLLVMATGTGKTYTAFQIIWRLWKAGRKKRILFLADRNVLVDQTMVNDFRPFGSAMAKLSTGTKVIEREDGASFELPTAIDRHRRIDTSYEVYLALYQAITGPEERQKLFRELSRDFFDLIVVDECHRGSAADDSAWRDILNHFSTATQIGMTATPKETEYVSNIHYFGKPIYTYSLRQGIHDGFLAPYKVIKVHIDRDIEGYRPEPGKVDREGHEVEDRIYNQKDFDRTLVIDDRTKLVAGKVSALLKESDDRFQKTIVFCVDTEHASRMRQALINENSEAAQTDRESRRDRLVAASLQRLIQPTGAPAFRENASFHVRQFPRLLTRPEHVQQLRETILNLAVRGQLVAQDANDPPALEMMKQIQAEKERLVKEGKTRKDGHSSPVVNQALTSSAPSGWQVVRAGELLTFVTSGSRGWAAHYTREGPIFLGIGNLDYGTTNLDLSEIQHVNPPKGAEGLRTLVQEGDILISITGDTGMVGLVPGDLPAAFINQHIALARPSARLYQRYLAMFFTSPSALADLRKSQRGIKNSLGLEDIRNVAVLLPPLAEQHRIVVKVDELFDLCDRLEAQLTKVRTERVRLLEAVLHEALRPAGDSQIEAVRRVMGEVAGVADDASMFPSRPARNGPSW